ncbi:MAG: hypothetical protein U5K31_08475 [Balneolaceae bacterium]|nr:hypothetical protein [Balneolaceae bacterium]
MKLLKPIISTLLLALFVTAGSAFGQVFDRDLQYFTAPDQRGLNEFEAPFTTNIGFDGVVVRIGGSNALQFQGLRHDNMLGTLPGLESNFNLATSNLDLDVALGEGLRMHLRTYLTSQHHTEAYVKSGYMQVDRLDFIQEGLLSGVMDHVRIKIGHMENNYGDNHFRRSDNGSAIHNPFVGNYIMDSFTTEVGGELYYYDGPWMAMFGLTNGKLNQSTLEGTYKTHASVLGKLAYDNQFSDDFRFRLSGSVYTTGQSPSIYLYSGDRAGSRYYNVLDDGFRSGRFAPSFTPGRTDPAGYGEMTSVMVNPFVKYGGLEFYGLYENATGKSNTESDSRSYNQYGAELLYRFGSAEDVYLGFRWNMVEGENMTDGSFDITRYNIGGGWFLTKNVLAKVEYVSQEWNGFMSGSKYDGAEFNGIMMEAVISF